MKKLLLLTAMMIASVGMMLAQPGHNSYQGHQGGNVGYNSAYDHGPPIMSQGEYQHALSTLDRQSFDSGRLTVAKQIVRSNNMLSRQIKGMMEMLSFESSRVKLAKYAYTRVADAQNYYVVNQAFHFSSSSRDLDRYMASHQAVSQPVATHGIIQGGGRPGLNSSCNAPLNSGTLTVSGGIRPVDAYPPPSGNIGYNHGAEGYGYDAPPAPAHPMMCEADFNRMVCMIQKKCFDADKLCLAKKAVCNYLLTSDQVLIVMELLTFESNKLKWAKFAYNQTCDQQNYWVVNDGFTFSSSIRNLECYINQIS